MRSGRLLAYIAIVREVDELLLRMNVEFSIDALHMGAYGVVRDH